MTSVLKPRHARQWLVVLGITVLGCAYAVFMIRFNRVPSVTLPDGTKVTYHSADRGVPQSSAGTQQMFRHAAPAQGNRLRDGWQRLHGKIPPLLRAWLPEWGSPPDNFPAWPDTNELELRLQFTGSLNRHPWDIYVADEKGWETVVPDYTAAPADASGPGWIRLGGPYPRHSKKIRVRFHPNQQLKAAITIDEQRAVAAELVLDNPFYEGPALAPGPKAPITKPFRRGQITLEKITRGRLVSGKFEDLRLNLALQRDGKPLDGYEIRGLEVSDRSGQRFRETIGGASRNNGRHSLSTSTAPWSDDLCWTVRIQLSRDNYFRDVAEEEKFVFDHLPVPDDSGVDVDRAITRNGISLHISRIHLSEHGDWRFCVEGWPPGNKNDHRIMIQDARDDQGRTHADHPRGGKPRIVGGPVGGSALGPVYSVLLPPDAKWWDLTLVPELAETIEFEVQPDFKE